MNGKGMCFNFVLSNGTRSTQSHQGRETFYTIMIPADALNKIRSVTIHYSLWIEGFSFFDKNGALLWEIEDTDSKWKETVVLGENERIVGVVAKLFPGH
jgi:hypothetical protein